MKLQVIKHNGSNYSFHLAIKHLAEEFEDSNLTFLGENTENYF